MPGRIGVDFGTSNTVVTLWSDSSNDSTTLQLKDYTRLHESDSGQIFIVPSLIHYTEDFKYLYGDQVLSRNLLHSRRTFQWMKRFICRRNRQERTIGTRKVDCFDAGKRFLSEILATAAPYLSLENEEIALTVPVEAFEDYSHWLGTVAHDARIFGYRVIDEPTAAALGHGAELAGDDVYLVFDFGGGTLDVAIVMIELSSSPSQSGRYCRVLGKAGVEMGGTMIDEWLFDEVLRRADRKSSDEDVREISRMVLAECERLKESLSFRERAEFTVMNPRSGSVIDVEMTRSELEDLLDKKGAFTQINKTIRRALAVAAEKGFDEDKIKAVLMVGGCSLIPSVQKELKRLFGNDKVLLKRPLDAVARGAAAFIAGAAFKDYIQHDYAIRYVNPATGTYEYRPLVRRGTPYPSTSVLAEITVKGSFDGQAQLGLPIFEIGGSASTPVDDRLEVFFDEHGIPMVHAVGTSEYKRRNLLWINESNPTFLRADPPCKRSEPRFRIEFSVDANRRLIMTAHDLNSAAVVFKNYPVAKLI